MNYRQIPIALAALGLVLAFSAGCSQIQVNTDWDHAVDFTKYRTFQWAPTKTSADAHRSQGSLLDARIQRAVADELQSRGLKRADGKGADLLLVYRTKSRNRVDVYGYRRRWGSAWEAHRYREGTLLIMMIDRATDQVVWEGIGVGVVGSTSGSDESVREAVAKILEDFPPQ